MRNQRIVYTIFLICNCIQFTEVFSIGREIDFDHLSVEQGLSQSTVTCILKDSRGFMWFGTNDGLNRYDGYEFRVYRHQKNHPNSISDNKIYSIIEDRKGRIWIGTRSGLNMYRREFDNFRVFLHEEKKQWSLSHNFVRTICEDAKGNIYIGTLGGGMNMYDPVNHRIKRLNPVCSGKYCEMSEFKNVSSIIEDHQGRIWVGTNNPGINLYLPEQNTYKMYPYQIEDRKDTDNYFGKKICLDHDNNIWICSEGNGLFMFNAQKKTFKHFEYQRGKNSISSNIVKDIIQMDNNIYWIATDGGGINVYNKEKDRFETLKYNIKKENSLSSNAVYTIYRDNENITWVGTFGGGINLLNSNKKKFHHYTQSPVKDNTLSHKSVLAFFEDHDGMIWIGTDGGGLNRFNPENEEYKIYTHDPDNINSLSSNVVTCIYEDSENHLWIGTYAGGLNLFDREKEIFTHYKKDYSSEKGLINNNVWVIYEDSRQSLWIGTLGGLDLFERDSEEFVHINFAGRNNSFFEERVIAMMEDSKNRIWVGGTYLSHVNIENKSLEPLALENFGNFDIRDIFEDSHGNIWIGTEGEGLGLYHEKDSSFTFYTTLHGLPNNAVHSILEDGNNHLWLSTNKGLVNYDVKTGNFRNYDVSDGLQSNQFSYNAALKANNGKMYFGGVNGFNSFYPDSIRDNAHIPPVVITGFTIFSKPVAIGGDDSPLDKHISETSELTLNYKQSVFTFEYKALNYTSSEKNRYRIKMEGFDDDWIDYDTRRYVSYTNLPAGDYTFRVIASNNDGIWNEEGTQIKIKILPPPWKTIWAYIVYIIAIVLLFYFFRKFLLTRAHLKHDLRMKELEKNKIEELNQMKLRFFTNISHEFRTPLTLILGPLEKFIKDENIDLSFKKQFSLMYRNAERLLRLINQLMDFRKIETGNMKLRASRGDIVSFTKEIKQAFNDFAHQHRIDFSFRTNAKTIESWFDRDKLEIILYNLLSNAFKFTPDDGWIKVIVNKTDRHLSEIKSDAPNNKGLVEIIISDSGIGISPERLPKIFDRFYQINKSRELRHSIEQTGTGVGLALTRSLIELHQGEINVESEVGKGATFKILLPLGKEHLSSEQIIEEISDQDFSQRPGHSLFVTQDKIPEMDVENRINKSINTEWPLILIVEDNFDLRNYMRQSMEHSYRVEIAENGAIGLEMARDINPDLIISDIMMPEMDGIVFCEKIKSDISTSHIPVIMLTALNSEEYKTKSYELGADDYVHKPFSTGLLETRVKNLIANRKKLREQFRKEALLEPNDVTITSADEQFLRKAVEIVEAHIPDAGFDVPRFVSMMNMSRSVLYRKLRAITDQSANEFIRVLRLKRAAQLLAKNELTVSEISYMVGFGDPQYFSKCFRKQYGKTPSEYASDTKQKIKSEQGS